VKSRRHDLLLVEQFRSVCNSLSHNPGIRLVS
jgi:hypothetical protein